MVQIFSLSVYGGNTDYSDLFLESIVMLWDESLVYSLVELSSEDVLLANYLGGQIRNRNYNYPCQITCKRCPTENVNIALE